MSDITEAMIMLARRQGREKERAVLTRDVLAALAKVHEYYLDLNLTVPAEAVARCRAAVREVFEKKE